MFEGYNKQMLIEKRFHNGKKRAVNGFFFMNDARDARESWIKSRYKRLASLVCKVSLRGMSTAQCVVFV